MSAIGHEQQIMQNPALGAVLLWRFSIAYREGHSEKLSAPLPLSFLILPMIWHRSTSQNIASTQIRSGLRTFVSKFSETRPSHLDMLLSLQHRSSLWRGKSLQAMKVGFASGLLTLSPEYRLVGENKEWRVEKQPMSVKEMCSRVEKIGAWFSPLSTHEVANILHIRF